MAKSNARPSASSSSPCSAWWQPAFAFTQMQAARKGVGRHRRDLDGDRPGLPGPPAEGGDSRPDPRRRLDECTIQREVGGGVACNTIQENGDETLQICQFITPGTLRVTTKSGTRTYAPARSVDASIILRKDTPSCVLHINPALFALPPAPWDGAAVLRGLRDARLHRAPQDDEW